MTYLQLALQPRFAVFTLSVFCAVLFAVLAWRTPSDTNFVMLALSLGLVALGVRDMLQTRHSILRNYPIVAHMRFLFEEVRPEIRQYFFEGEKDGAPFSRDRRSVVYQRAKMALDKIPFGTQYNVYSEGYEWMRHSMAPRPVSRKSFRVQVGGTQCKQPYSASVYNISAMSFGAISANAIRAMNKGAAAGGFAHDTGEGGVSRYHREFGGDLIWEIGSGYFGCRDGKGAFSPERFAATAKLEQIRMIEIKLSQGAKPGHGGVLPGAKVSAEIAADARRHRRRRLHFAGHAFGFQHAARADGIRRATARAVRRQADRVQTVRRPSLGISRHLQGHDRDRHHARTSSWWTARKAARALRRWSSPTTWACRCARASTSCITR